MKQNVGLIHRKNLWSKKSCNERRGKTTSHLRILTPLKGSKSHLDTKKNLEKCIQDLNQMKQTKRFWFYEFHVFFFYADSH